MPGAGAGVGVVSWLCAWWRQLGAGCAGGDRVCWLCVWWRQGAGRRWCCELAVRVVETGCRVPVLCWVLCARGGDRLPVPVSQGAATSREAEGISNQNSMVCPMLSRGSSVPTCGLWVLTSCVACICDLSLFPQIAMAMLRVWRQGAGAGAGCCELPSAGRWCWCWLRAWR